VADPSRDLDVADQTPCGNDPHSGPSGLLSHCEGLDDSARRHTLAAARTIWRSDLVVANTALGS
jgi:hypothetical protein